MRARRQPMSRQEFLNKVEQLLGTFDSDSFMHGFNSGVDRSCDLIRDWVVKEMPVSVLRNQLLRRIREVKRVRR